MERSTCNGSDSSFATLIGSIQIRGSPAGLALYCCFRGKHLETSINSARWHSETDICKSSGASYRYSRLRAFRSFQARAYRFQEFQHVQRRKNCIRISPPVCNVLRGDKELWPFQITGQTCMVINGILWHFTDRKFSKRKPTPSSVVPIFAATRSANLELSYLRLTANLSAT